MDINRDMVDYLKTEYFREDFDGPMQAPLYALLLIEMLEDGKEMLKYGDFEGHH